MNNNPRGDRFASSAVRLAVVASFSSAAWCQTSDAVATAQEGTEASGDAPRRLQTVTVRGNRPSSLPSQIPTTIEGITGREVETRINATDSEDALKYLPSLLVRKRYIGDYNHAVLSTRASGTGNSARSLVYADGILLSNLLGNGATFTPRWGLVTPEEIDRVDVLYGPFSAAYPGNSVGAVVDYVTRMPTRFEAHAKIGAFTQPFELDDTQATYTGRQASASLGDRAGAFAWWLNVNRLDSEGQPLVFATRQASAGSAPPTVPTTPVTGAVPGRNRMDQDWFILGTSAQYHTVQDHAKAKLAYEFGGSLKASYTLGVWQNKSEGQPQSYLRDSAGNAVYGGAIGIDGLAYTGASGNSAGLLASDFPLTREALTHTMHALSLKSTTGGVFDWEAAASVYDYTQDLARTNTTTLPGAASGGAGRLTDMKGTGWSTFALKGIWRPGAEAGTHVADFGLQRDRFALRKRFTAPSDDWIHEDAGTLTARAEGTTTLTSLWAQDAWQVAPQWKTFAGGRWERWRATDGLTQSGQLTQLHSQRGDTSFSPKAALAYHASAEWTLKLSTGRAIRYPTVSELYQGSFNTAGVFVDGDPDLKPERSWTTELSSEWQSTSQRLRATLFHENTRDALYSQTNTTVTPNVTNVQNVDEIRTVGLELAHRAQDLVIKGLALGTSVTYADSEVVRNDKFPASVGKRQIRVPKWRASLLASWKATDSLTATFGARYSGKQYSTLDNIDPNGFAYQGTSRFFTTDLRLHYQGNRQWSAAVGIDNLNNYRYWNFHPYPQRTYSAEVKFDH